MGHYDVQPVGHLTDWSTGPFAAEIRDGKLYARGAANSKGDLIARLAAVEAYQKTFGKLPVTLRFIVEGEDGLGSPSLYRFTDEHAEMLKADGCLWDEGSSDTREESVVSLGFKGITFPRTARVSGRARICIRSGARLCRIPRGGCAGTRDHHVAEGRDHDRWILVAHCTDQRGRCGSSQSDRAG
jgi:hypothetical protein